MTWESELKQSKLVIKRRLKTAKKSLKRVERHLNECQEWSKKHHLATLLQANFYQIPKNEKEVKVWDWESDKEIVITLNPQLKLSEEIAKRFKKVKKLEAGLPYAEREYQRTCKYLNLLESQIQQLESISSEEAWENWKQSNSIPKKQAKKAHDQIKASSKSYWEYFSCKMIPLWIGKSASANEDLTFRHARGNDLWLHVTEFPGSHVVIHLQAHQELDDETLKDALQLALHYSKARPRQEAEVSLTHVKYVKKYGREKGKVQIAQEKRFLVRYNHERLEAIKKRTTPIHP